MKVQSLVLFASAALGAVVKREQFSQGQPIDDKGKGAPILGNSIPPYYSTYHHC
jgi:oxalate decarboxylase